jgi:hypothetical protein
MAATYGQSVGDWLAETGIVQVRERLLHPSSRQLLLAELRIATSIGLVPENETAEVLGNE